MLSLISDKLPIEGQANEVGGKYLSTKTDRQAMPLIEGIKADIAFGRLRPNQHLIEDEIGVRFNVSRHVVRAALVALERMGLVTRRPNRGAIVRDFSVEQVEQIYEVRVVLQREAARRIPMPASESDIAELTAIHAEYCQHIDAGELLKANTFNDVFHRRIWAMCTNKYLTEMIDRLRQEITGIRWYGVGNAELLKDSRQDHADMIEFLRTGDRQAFTTLLVEHMLPPLEAFRRAHGTKDRFVISD